VTLTDVKLLFLILWEFHENRTVTIRLVTYVITFHSVRKKKFSLFSILASATFY